MIPSLKYLGSCILYYSALALLCPLWLFAQPYDYGDLPASYGTLAVDFGSRHTVVPGFMLGSALDVDPDGVPSPLADGDDTDADGDDEDGITFLSNGFAPCTTDSVRIFLTNTAGLATAFLDLWIDFNGNGVYDVDNERVTDPTDVEASLPLVAGENTYTFSVPCEARPGPSFSRARLSSTGSLAVAGNAIDGEVEDYAVTVLGLDYGDAPDNGTPDPLFQTHRVNNGPSHILRPGGPILGAGVDAEPDGIPNVAGLGDDASESDDEDGIAPIIMVHGTSSSCLTATSSSGGLLDAWIDVNGNNRFEQNFERITPPSGLNLVAALPTEICFSHPQHLPTALFARFRISSEGGLLPTGPANDGEVEDYIVDTSLPVELSDFRFEVEGQIGFLRWTTLSEDNNAGFEVEQSIDGRSFTSIGFVEGAIVSLEPITYEYELGKLEPGLHQFRLKQVDLNGTSVYSPVLESHLDVPDTYSLSAPYPNPFYASASFTLTAPEPEHVEIALFDVSGRKVQNLFSGFLSSGIPHTFSILGSTLPYGSYLLMVRGTQAVTSRVLIHAP